MSLEVIFEELGVQMMSRCPAGEDYSENQAIGGDPLHLCFLFFLFSANKQWVHPPEALLRGHIVYNVKFLGQCEVDTPKGTEVVKDAIRKMKVSLMFHPCVL